MIGLVGFGVTSVLCGLAPNIEFLIVARLLQGAAGAILVPGSLAILTTNFEGEEQGRAFGIWAGASGIAPILGPFVGGLLVDEVSWRAIFLLNIPFIVVAVWATLKYVKEITERGRRAATSTGSARSSWRSRWRPFIRCHLRPAAAVAGPDRVHRARHRRRRHRGDAVLLRAGAQPAGPAGPVQVAQLHRHEHLDAAHLRRAVRGLCSSSRSSCRARLVTRRRRSAWERSRARCS